MSDARWVKRALAVLLVGAAAIFIGRTIADNWQELRTYRWRADLPLLAASVVAHVAVLAWGVYLWSLVLRQFGVRGIGFRPLLRIWALANGTKYIPGGFVWQFVAAAQMSAAVELSRVAAISSMLAHVFFSLVTAVAVAAVTLPLGQLGAPAELTVTLRALAVAGAIVAVHPAVLNAGLRLIPRAARREVLRWHGSWIDGLRLLVLATFSWAIYGVAYFLFVRSVAPLGWATLGVAAGVNALSFVAGFIAVPAPGGLGVREGVMTALLGTLLPTGVAAVVAIAARLWSIVAELALAAVAIALTHRGGTRPPQGSDARGARIAAKQPGR